MSRTKKFEFDSSSGYSLDTDYEGGGEDLGRKFGHTGSLASPTNFLTIPIMMMEMTMMLMTMMIMMTLMTLMILMNINKYYLCNAMHYVKGGRAQVC